MKTESRLHLIVLGLLCLMPALFFWVVNSARVDNPFGPAELLFGGVPQFELYCCAIFFPLLGVVMGWLALRFSHRRLMGWVVILIGLVELAAGMFAALS